MGKTNFCGKCTYKENCKAFLKEEGSKIIFNSIEYTCIGTKKGNECYEGIKEFDFMVKHYNPKSKVKSGVESWNERVLNQK